MKLFYALCCVLGTLLPLSQFVPWLREHGFNFRLLLQEISTDRLSSFAWLDVLISAIALIGFIVVDSKKTSDQLWLVFYFSDLLCWGVLGITALFAHQRNAKKHQPCFLRKAKR